MIVSLTAPLNGPQIPIPPGPLLSAPPMIEFLGAREHGAWDDYVLAHPQATFFHQLLWREVVRDVFGHQDCYLVALRDGRIAGVLPMFLVASRLAGRLLVSVPYGVGGGVLADDDTVVNALAREAISIAERRNCRSIDLRSEQASVPGWSVVDRYMTFRRELPDSPAEVLGWLPRKARAAARNGRKKFGLEILHGNKYLKQVWNLYTLSMRRLGTLSYPYSFFRKTVEHTPNGHVVSLATWNGRPVAGLLSFVFRDRVMPYFLGTSTDARRCSAANYIYLCLMEWAVEEGLRVFDFGRSRVDNTGSSDFKRFQGFTPTPMSYQNYLLPGQSPPKLSPADARYRLARKVWPHLPLWLTKAVGARLAVHLPG